MSDSRAAFLLKQAKRIKRKTHKANPDLVLAEGKAIIEMALAARVEVLALFVADESFEAQFGNLEIPIIKVSKRDFQELASTVSPQGIVALLIVPKYTLDDISSSARTLLYLEEIRDPGNLGTIVRTADAFGVDAVLLSPGCVDLRNNKFIRSSAGSVFNLPIISDVQLNDLDDIKSKFDADLLVTSLTGNIVISDLDIPKSRCVIWAVGNEATGVSDLLVAMADQVVKIPMLGKAESLNAAVAAAVCLYVSAQRKSPSRA